MTIVWDTKLAMHKQECEVVEIDKGIGHKFDSVNEIKIKIRDSERQLEYHAIPAVKQPCNKRDLLQLTMGDEFFIGFTPITGQALNDKPYQNHTLRTTYSLADPNESSTI